MNYWLLTTEYPPLYGGGISTYCYHTAKMLAARGHAVTVFLPDDQVRDYQISEQEAIRIIRFGTDRTGTMNDIGHIARQSYEFAAIVRDMIRLYGKPDCIEAQEYLAIAYHLLQFRLLRYPELDGVPIVITLHSPAFLYLYYNREGEYEFPNYWTGEMEMSCIRSADWVIAPSQYIIDEIKKHLQLDGSRLSVIHNPYHFEKAAGHSKIQRNKIVFFGKLSPQKGVFEMFEYMKRLWDEGFPHPLTVIGGTEKVYYPEMRTMGQIIEDKYASYISKGLIQFMGKIPPSKRDEYLSDAHVILIPSRNDNLPYACIEAMSIGKVVLASVQGGQSELVEEGVSGFLFDHNDPASFGKQLHHILSLGNDALDNIGNNAAGKIKGLLGYERIYHEKTLLLDQLIHKTGLPALFPFVRSPFPEIPAPPAAETAGLLSIVIPFFNLGTYIRECISSLLVSGYSPIEILVVDDGSTDPQSIGLLQQLEHEPSVRVLRKKNEGLALTRNFGALNARGEFLAFLDADDKVAPEYYSRAIEVLQHYPNVSFVGAWVQYFGEKKGKWITWNPEPPYILLHNSVNSSALVYKRAAFLSGGLNDKMVDYGIEDYESVINMMAHGYRGVVLPECLFFYRIRKDSMYRQLTKYKALYSYQYIANKHSLFYNTFAPQIFSLQNANGPSFTYDNPTFQMHVISRPNYPGHTLGMLKAFIKKNPFLKKIVLRIIKR